MQIHITPHHLTLTPALRSFTAGKIGALGDMVSEIVAAHVVLRLDPKAAIERRFSARVRLAVRGADVFASGVDGNLYSAIDQVVDKLVSGLSKRKTRLRTHHKRRTRVAALAVG